MSKVSNLKDASSQRPAAIILGCPISTMHWERGCKREERNLWGFVPETLKTCTSYDKSFNKCDYIANSVYLKRELHSCLSYLHTNRLQYFWTL